MKMRRTIICKNGHPRTPANTYTHPITGAESCRACNREYRQRKSGSNKRVSTFYTKMREQEIADERPDAERHLSRLQRERFEHYFGPIREIYTERTWLTRLGVFVLGWKEAEEHHAKIPNRPGMSEPSEMPNQCQPDHPESLERV